MDRKEVAGDTGTRGSTRAVAYVRMSTDPQQFSIENQLAEIRRYAEVRGFEVVRVYEDAGRSGLTLGGREGLTRLMADVASGSADFQAILAYDISRWGRFQDADESAHYEFLCSRAGIQVHYCAEQFDNDGTTSSVLLKAVKRVMAREHSRELSVKVFAGQCRLVERGFRQGGMAGFGLRRLLVDEAGVPKGELVIGQRKSFQTDRVILVPGPDEEVRTVRRMYRMFVEDGRGEAEIAATLNHEGVRTDLWHPWTRGTVHQVLTNEKYVGNNVFNRRSFKLKQRRVVNAPGMWVRARHAFQPLVEEIWFERARAIVEARSRRYDDAQLLDLLRSLLQAQGALSGVAIDERGELPSSSVYRRRFGSLLRAYTLIGYEPEHDYRYVEVNRTLRRMHPETVAMVMEGIRRVGGSAERDPVSDLLTVNGEFTASVVIARCRETPAGSLRWRIRLDAVLAPDITVAIRMDDGNATVLDHYLLPGVDMTDPRLRLAERNGLSLDAYRFETLDTFFALCARAPFEDAA
ncbi:recombinase family protein [Methylobacterium sp. J-092]|uniref:recombinase family protein n=1 Tax=Methylobacterium sp. J-092 TaxID=2836667 RepID=UPI0024445C43